MKKEDFFKEVEKTLSEIREVLIHKNREYMRYEDPFHNFNEGAIRAKKTREEVLDGFLLKHEVSIADITSDFVEDGILHSKETINEKFNDNIIYLILKKLMFISRLKESDK